MTVDHAMMLLVAVCLGCVATSHAEEITIDESLAGGGDCGQIGTWEAASGTCRVTDYELPDQDRLFIVSGRLVVEGTLRNDGTIDNRATLEVNGFLNSVNDLVNFWDGEMIVRGQFFSHFMYNFGSLRNESTGTIEFEFHVENNAPMTNYGHIDIGGSYINIPARWLDNHGSITIQPTGQLSNEGRVVNTGLIDNTGILQNSGELIDHCEGSLTGNPVTGSLPTPAQSLFVDDGLQWCAIDGATGYDVVAGDLDLLRSSGGDYALATTGCLGDELSGLSLTAAPDPAAGDGLWFLVRANAGGTGSYDSAFSSQVASRDAGVNGAVAGCP